MRTTLDISDDVLFAAKQIARLEKKPLGRVISELARRALAQPAGILSDPELMENARSHVSERLASFGIHPLPARGGPVSSSLVDRLQDQGGV